MSFYFYYYNCQDRGFQDLYYMVYVLQYKLEFEFLVFYIRVNIRNFRRLYFDIFDIKIFQVLRKYFYSDDFIVDVFCGLELLSVIFLEIEESRKEWKCYYVEAFQQFYVWLSSKYGRGGKGKRRRVAVLLLNLDYIFIICVFYMFKYILRIFNL